MHFQKLKNRVWALGYLKLSQKIFHSPCRGLRRSSKMAIWLPSDVLLVGPEWRSQRTQTHQVQHQTKPMSRKRAVPGATQVRKERQFWRCKVRPTRRRRDEEIYERWYDLYQSCRGLRWNERALSGHFCFLNIRGKILFFSIWFFPIYVLKMVLYESLNIFHSSKNWIGII